MTTTNKIHLCLSGKDIITDSIIKSLRAEFSNPNNYLETMKVLRETRNYLGRLVVEGKENYKQDPLYPMFDALNRLYSCLWSVESITLCEKGDSNE